MRFSKLEQQVLQFLSEHRDNRFKTNDLALALDYSSSKNFKKLVKALNFLEQQGEITVDQRGRFAINQSSSVVTGTYRANARGFGFVTYEEKEADLFVPKGKENGAMDGDTVEVKIIKKVDPSTGKGSLAEVTKVIERAANKMVGEFYGYSQEERETTGYLGYVVPQGDYPKEMRIQILPGGIHPALESICIVQIKDYANIDGSSELTGLVSKEIGHKNEPGVDILSILYQFNIPNEFPEQVIDEANAIEQEIDPKDIEGRLDLRNELIITIDGESAKDLDDAISLEKISDQHYRLGVHIADVSHYVQFNSAIDKEAKDRGTSVYLTDRVVPMLPQRLSNGICSLLPDEDRLTVSCMMDIDDQGKVFKHDIQLSVIHSSYRMTYTDVNLMIEGDLEKRQEFQEIATMVDEMAELHRILEKMRRNRGALDFDTQEAEIVVDEEGHPLDIVLRERKEAERLIESFMLAANETVAEDFKKRLLPFIYRIHEQPDVERMDRFAEFITSFGMILRGNTDSIQPKQLQTALNKIKGQPYETVVSTMMLRSMQQAKYSENPEGHYGLATRDYTHFTSPIRRYPDLLVHRLIHLYLKGRPDGKTLTQWESRIPGIAEHSSRMERRAVDAERETEAIKKAEYMLDKIGLQYEGMITSVTNFGMFVSLPNSVEGLIRLQDLKGDYFEFNQQHMMLIGERTGQVFRIGQKVTVEVAAVSVEEREIDFNLIHAEPLDDVTVVAAKLDHQRDSKQKKMSRKVTVDPRDRKDKKDKRNFKIRRKKR